MKSNYFALSCFVVLCGFGFGLLLPYGFGQKIGIEFEEEIVNLGVIERQSEVSHKLTFKNHFYQPVWIENIKRSCGCLTPNFSTEPIASGESGEILIKLDSKQGIGKRNEGIVKNITIKFGPVGLEKVIAIRALPLDDLITDFEEVRLNAERKATNQIKVERGFLSEQEFNELSIDVAEGAKVIIAARKPDFIEFAVNYQGRKFSPSDLILLKYKKRQKEVVKWLRMVEEKTGMPDLRPLNYFKKFSKDVVASNLKEISLVKFVISDGDKKLEVVRVFCQNGKIAQLLNCTVGQDAKNEFSISLVSIPESSITEEAVVEFVELGTGKKRTCRLPLRVLVYNGDF